MFCPSCGAQCPPGSIACHQCGAILPGLPGLAEPLRPSAAGDPTAPATHAVRVEPITVSPMPAHHPPQHVAQPAGGNATVMAEAQSYYQPPRRAPMAEDQLVGRVKLVVEQGKILGEQFLLSDPEIMIGRYDQGSGTCPDIDLTAQDPAYVHRQHVRLTFSPGGHELVAWDLGGRNGSYVNNQKIEPHTSARVRVGDKLRVGRVVMRLQQASENEIKGQSR